jgi:Fe-S-cluster-containing hydrogenase component 2
MRWERKETCDLCMGEDQPLCVKYCTYQVLEIGEEKGKIANR